MLSVVSKEFHSERQGTVIIAGATQEEVMSPDARRLAIATGTEGLNRPGVSGNESAYPVNADGETSEDLMFGRNGQTVAGYRCDYKLNASL